ncbi:MAG: T9SS type A sorting domain-containing protein [Bacteroidota bacterium]
MKKSFLLFCSVLLCASLMAQPTINGSDAGDTDYITLATWTQGNGNTGFGPYGILELKAYTDNSNLYLMVLGDIEDNFNAIAIFIDVSDITDGVAACTQLPSGSDALSPFNGLTTTLDFSTDYGVRYNGGGVPYEGFVSIIDYTGGGNTDTPLFGGGIAGNGTSSTQMSGTFAGTEAAYINSTDLNSRSGDEGFEIKIPLSSIGASSSSSFQFFALQSNGAGNFISANTLPEIAGQGGSNLGNSSDVNFCDIPGNQFTSDQVLPVDLLSFSAKAQLNEVQLQWVTASEINNSHFELQRSSNGKEWTALDKVLGAGNSVQKIDYSFVDASPLKSVNYYRLKQVDFDGAYEYSSIVSVTIDGKNATVYPTLASSEIIVTQAVGVATLYDMSGKLVRQFQINDEVQTLDIQDLINGKYLLELNKADGTIETTWIVKQ